MKKEVYRIEEVKWLEEERARKVDIEARDYKYIMVDEKMKFNKEMVKKYEFYEDVEDDFM